MLNIFKVIIVTLNMFNMSSVVAQTQVSKYNL